MLIHINIANSVSKVDTIVDKCVRTESLTRGDEFRDSSQCAGRGLQSGSTTCLLGSLRARSNTDFSSPDHVIEELSLN